MHDGPTRFKTRFSRISLKRPSQSSPPSPPLPPSKPSSSSQPQPTQPATRRLDISYPYPLAAHGLPSVSHTPKTHSPSRHKSWRATPAVMPATIHGRDADFVPYVAPVPPVPPIPPMPPKTDLAAYPVDIDAYADAVSPIDTEPPLRNLLAIPASPTPPSSPRSSRGNRRPPPPPIDIASVKAKYPARGVRDSEIETGASANVNFKAVGRPQASVSEDPVRAKARKEAEALLRVPNHYSNVVVHDHPVHPGHNTPVPQVEPKKADAVPVPLRSGGNRFPTWTPRVTDPEKPQAVAYSQNEDLGAAVMQELLLTPRPPPPAPPSPSTSFADTLAAAARAAKRKSQHVVNTLKTMPMPIPRKKTVRIQEPDPESGWGSTPRRPGVVGATPPADQVSVWSESPRRPEREWAMGGVDLNRVNAKIRDARKNKSQEKNRKKRKLCLVLLIIVILAIIIGLCAGLIPRKNGSAAPVETKSPGKDAPKSGTPSGSPVPNTSAAATPGSPDPKPTSTKTVPQCLQEFSTAQDADKFNCAECVPVLSTIPNGYATDAPDASMTAGRALQFCALMEFAALLTEPVAGWGKSINVCSTITPWAGIQCDNRGRVTNLSPPTIPARIPFSIGNMPGLTMISIKGNGSHPHGDFPTVAIQTLTKLTNLQIANTAVKGDVAGMNWSFFPNLNQLSFSNNSMLSDTLPDVSMLKLVTFTYAGQRLTSVDLKRISPSVNFLDLSDNRLTGQMPDFASLSNITALYLQNNDYTQLMSNLPPKLGSLNLASNSKLAGALPAAFCNNASVGYCNVKDTALTGPVTNGTAGSCPSCDFLSTQP